MKRFVRANNNIYDLDKVHILESDYIEELLDKIAITDNSEVPPRIVDVEEAIYWYNLIKKTQDMNSKVYGAIWADEGLKYVAELTGSGWVLLED